MSDSIWKKEISFKKKGKAAADPDAFELPKQAKEPKAAKESIWKKERSLGRNKDRGIDLLGEQAAQAVAPGVPTVESVPTPRLTEPAEAVVGAIPDPDLPAQDPVAFVSKPAVEPPPVLEPAGELPVDDTPAQVEPRSSRLAEILAAAAEPAPVPAAPRTPEPVGESWFETELLPETAEPWLTEPELPPAHVAAVAAMVHPPVPAAELPPLLDPPARTPFWKKELSVSRRPKAEKAEKPARTQKEKGAPFWKKELSASRRSKAEKAEKPACTPKVKGAPFWKKLLLGRKPKAALGETPTEQLPAAPKAPLLKRQLSLPALSMLKRPSRGGGANGGHSAKRLVGLKIGSSQLAAARIYNNGVAELQQLAREPLAHGVVVGGELRDPEALGDALKVFFARHKLPKKGVRLGIASNRIGVRILEIVGIDEEKQLANAVHFRAQEALPIPLDEAVLDYRVLDESVDAAGRTVKRVLLVVVYRELIDRYVSACRRAGIDLIGIDLEAFALLRALGSPTDRENSALVGVAIGHDRSTFAVSDGRVCEFTRVVEWGGSALNVALARAFDNTPSEVETMKRGLSLDGSTTPEELTPEQLVVALDAVRRQVQSFARELVSSLQFYQNQPGSLGIGEIVVTGGTAHLPGLAEELERLIGVHVRIGDPLERLSVAKRFAGTEQMGSLAVAIGLGIED
jgi:type IV pilus assembly protein PilM